MTCIVGIVSGSKTHMGADGLLLWASGQIDHCLRPKIWRSNGWLIGTSGPVGWLDGPDDTDDLPERGYSSHEEIREWIFESARQYREHHEPAEWAVMIGGAGLLMVAASNGYWAPHPALGYAAIGQELAALGALHATQGLGVRTRIKRALLAATYHCTGVGEPYTILQA